jgi:hypothetical protein
MCFLRAQTRLRSGTRAWKPTYKFYALSVIVRALVAGSLFMASRLSLARVMKSGIRDTRAVPCGSCQVCCKMSWVFLDPEAGDVAERYDTVEVVHPKTGALVKALAHKPNGGGCIYLGSAGCTIHGTAPSLCRAFDCRAYYLDMKATPRTVRKRALSEQYSAQELFEAGRELQRKFPVNEWGNTLSR